MSFKILLKWDSRTPSGSEANIERACHLYWLTTEIRPSAGGPKTWNFLSVLFSGLYVRKYREIVIALFRRSAVMAYTARWEVVNLKITSSTVGSGCVALAPSFGDLASSLKNSPCSEKISVEKVKMMDSSISSAWGRFACECEEKLAPLQVLIEFVSVSNLRIWMSSDVIRWEAVRRGS
jgi:hypothetical protein